MINYLHCASVDVIHPVLVLILLRVTEKLTGPLYHPRREPFQKSGSLLIDVSEATTKYFHACAYHESMQGFPGAMNCLL